MDAKDGRQSLLTQAGQMGQGAERAIAHEHLLWAPRRLERRALGQVMGVPGRREHVQQEARARMKQGEQVGHGDTTPRALPTGLATGLLQCWCIGHGNTGPVDQAGPVAPPAALIVGRLLADRCRPPPQRLPDDERSPRAGLTKR